MGHSRAEKAETHERIVLSSPLKVSAKRLNRDRHRRTDEGSRPVARSDKTNSTIQESYPCVARRIYRRQREGKGAQIAGDDRRCAQRFSGAITIARAVSEPGASREFPEDRGTASENQSPTSWALACIS